MFKLLKFFVLFNIVYKAGSMFDREYKDTIKKHLCHSDSSLQNLIAGEEEFKHILQNLDKSSFSPLINNIDNMDFCANLHVHTTASDGIATPQEILDSAAEVAQKNGKNFIVAITDHDSLDGIKNLLPILTSNPEKYKNIKVVAGVELSTVATDFENQTATFDIHTLVYGINPFDEELNNFIDKKKRLKFELAQKTLEKLKSSLQDITNKLNIELTLNEAAKIHPMILKGEDEVSHPLKKYIYAKLLFAHYVESDSGIKTVLNKYNIQNEALSYEKPVYAYKSMFNNEKYFYIYKDALQKYLNKLTNNKENFVLPEIPDYMVKALLLGKQICENSHPSRHNKLNAFTHFEDALSFINTQKYGLISIAHPARLNLKAVNGDLSNFFDEFFYVYKKYGKDKAFAYEKHYQSYSKNKVTKEILDIIDKSAEKFSLQATGGVDSHGKNVCSRM